MKKIVSVLLALMLVFGAFGALSLTASAAGTVAYTWEADKTSAAPGEYVTFTFKLGSNPNGTYGFTGATEGFASMLNQYIVNFVFNPAVFEYDDATTASIVTPLNGALQSEFSLINKISTTDCMPNGVIAVKYQDSDSAQAEALRTPTPPAADGSYFKVTLKVKEGATPGATSDFKVLGAAANAGQNIVSTVDVLGAAAAAKVALIFGSTTVRTNTSGFPFAVTLPGTFTVASAPVEEPGFTSATKTALDGKVIDLSDISALPTIAWTPDSIASIWVSHIGTPGSYGYYVTNGRIISTTAFGYFEATVGEETISWTVVNSAESNGLFTYESGVSSSTTPDWVLNFAASGGFSGGRVSKLEAAYGSVAFLFEGEDILIRTYTASYCSNVVITVDGDSVSYDLRRSAFALHEISIGTLFPELGAGTHSVRITTTSNGLFYFDGVKLVNGSKLVTGDPDPATVTVTRVDAEDTSDRRTLDGGLFAGSEYAVSNYARHDKGTALVTKWGADFQYDFAAADSVQVIGYKGTGAWSFRLFVNTSSDGENWLEINPTVNTRIEAADIAGGSSAEVYQTILADTADYSSFSGKIYGVKIMPNFSAGIVVIDAIDIFRS